MRDERSLLTLVAEIRQELSYLEQLTEDIGRTWARREEVAAGDRQTHVESTALKLHNSVSSPPLSAGTLPRLGPAECDT